MKIKIIIFLSIVCGAYAGAVDEEAHSSVSSLSEESFGEIGSLLNNNDVKNFRSTTPVARNGIPIFERRMFAELNKKCGYEIAETVVAQRFGRDLRKIVKTAFTPWKWNVLDRNRIGDSCFKTIETFCDMGMGHHHRHPLVFNVPVGKNAVDVPLKKIGACHVTYFTKKSYQEQIAIFVNRFIDNDVKYLDFSSVYDFDISEDLLSTVTKGLRARKMEYLRFSPLGTSPAAKTKNQAIIDVLGEVDLTQCELADLHRSSLFVLPAIKEIRKNNKVKQLVITEHTISQKVVNELVGWFQSGKFSLTHLKLNSNPEPGVNFGPLFSAIKSSDLTSFSLSKVYLNNQQFPFLAEMLQSPKNQINTLILDDINLKGRRVNMLASALKSPHSKVESLSIPWSDFGTNGFAVLLDALSGRIRKLNLEGSHLDTAHAEMLAEVLKSGRLKLTELDLDNNQIGTVGLNAIISAVNQGKVPLRQLLVGSNLIGGGHLTAEIELLAHTSIEKLDLRNNALIFSDVAHLANIMMTKGNNLKVLDLSRAILENGVEALYPGLTDENNQLVFLNLEDSLGFDTPLLPFLNAVSNANCKLEKLNIRNNYGRRPEPFMDLPETTGNRRLHILQVDRTLSRTPQVLNVQQRLLSAFKQLQ